MPAQINIPVDDPPDILTLYGAGAKVRLERATSSSFSDTVEVGTQTIVATTSTYEFFDPAGSSSSWYRSRYSTATPATGNDYSAYSDSHQAGAPNAYATVDALREFLRLPDDSRDNVLSDLLLRVTSKINLSLGFDFFRHPAVTGTEIRLFDGNNRSWLHVTQGILSLTLVRAAQATGYTYTSMATTDWRLRSPVQDGGPYLELQLTGVGSYPSLYYGYDTVELTGVFGYSSIPPAIEQATLMWAADLYRLGAGGGTPLSATGEEFGETRFIGGMPRFTWETVEDYRKLHQGALVA